MFECIPKSVKYFGQKTGDGSPKKERRGWKTEDGSLTKERRGWKTEDRSPNWKGVLVKFSAFVFWWQKNCLNR
jgi:hypothetical protein